MASDKIMFRFVWTAKNGIAKELVQHCASVSQAKRHAGRLRDKEQVPVEVYRHDDKWDEDELVYTAERR